MRRVIVPLRQQSGDEVETCSALMQRVPARGAAKSAAARRILYFAWGCFRYFSFGPAEATPCQLIHSEKQ
jgi:hypothetical protein